MKTHSLMKIASSGAKIPSCKVDVVGVDIDIHILYVVTITYL